MTIRPEVLETTLGNDIVTAAEMRCGTYREHLNKVTQTKQELAELLGRFATDPVVTETAEKICGEWRR
ncbi:MAG: hypothetical protein AAGA83_20855 [Cyanobacteria bacterium P01_F01_bin.116]